MPTSQPFTLNEVDMNYGEIGLESWVEASELHCYMRDLSLEIDILLH